MLYELTARYDARKSFYGKAQIKEEKNCLTLYSYGTKVAKINLSKNITEIFNTQSQTTLRHIKEFLKQNNFKVESKAQIIKDYWRD